VATPVAVFTALSARPLVEAVYGEAYSPAAQPLRVLALAYLLPLAGSAGLTQYLVAKGDNRTVLEASLLSNAVQLAALYPLTRAAGAPGVAAAILLSQAAGLLYARARAGVEVLELNPLPPALLAAVPALPPLLLNLRPLPKVLVGFALYAAAYLLAAFKVGVLTEADLAMLRRAVRLPGLARQPSGGRAAAGA